MRNLSHFGLAAFSLATWLVACGGDGDSVTDTPPAAGAGQGGAAGGAGGAATCSDGDGDGYGEGDGCKGPDCDDGDINVWQACGACVDADKDGLFVGCDQFLTVQGPDCDDGSLRCTKDCADSNSNAVPDCKETLYSRLAGGRPRGGLSLSGDRVLLLGDSGTGTPEMIGVLSDWGGQLSWYHLFGAETSVNIARAALEVGDELWLTGDSKDRGALTRLDSKGFVLSFDLLSSRVSSLSALLPDPAGGFMALGVTTTDTQQHDIWAVKLTSSGAISWQKTFGDTYDQSIGKAIRAQNGDLIGIGNYSGHIGGGNYSAPLVVRFDASMHILWSRLLDGFSGEDLAGIVELPGGDLVVAGGFSVARLSGTGNVLFWSRNLGINPEDSGIAGLGQSGGQLLISSGSSINGNDPGFVLRLDPDGAVVWQRYVPLSCLLLEGGPGGTVRCAGGLAGGGVYFGIEQMTSGGDMFGPCSDHGPSAMALAPGQTKLTPVALQEQTLVEASTKIDNVILNVGPLAPSVLCGAP